MGLLDRLPSRKPQENKTPEDEVYLKETLKENLKEDDSAEAGEVIAFGICVGGGLGLGWLGWKYVKWKSDLEYELLPELKDLNFWEALATGYGGSWLANANSVCCSSMLITIGAIVGLVAYLKLTD